MRLFFTDNAAKKIIVFCLFFIIAILVSTPLRSTVVIAFLMFYSLTYLYLNKAVRPKEKLGAWGWTVIAILIAYFIGRFGPFVISGFSGRYISAGLHVAASIPIFLMLRRLINIDYLPWLHKFMALGLGIGGLGAGAVALWQTQILEWKAADGFLFSINFGYLSCVIFALCLALLPAKNYRKWLLFGGLGALIAVVLSGSRGAIFPIPLLVMIWIALSLKTVSLRYILIAIFAIPVLSFFVYSSVPTIKERTDVGLSEINSFLKGDLKREGSFNYRVQVWIAAMEAAKQSPLFGLTYVEREELNKKLIEQDKVVPWVGTLSRGHAHSQYFETLATGGVVGVLALLVYMFLPLLLYFKIYLSDRNNFYSVAGILFTLAYVFCGLTEVLLQQEMIAAFYGFMQVVLLLMAKNKQVVDE